MTHIVIQLKASSITAITKRSTTKNLSIEANDSRCETLSTFADRTALDAAVTDMKLMMHRGWSIFRLLGDVTVSTLGGNGGITSTLQQRHSGSIDLTPLHPISAVVRINLDSNTHHTPKHDFTCVHLHGDPASMACWYQRLLSPSSLSFSLCIPPSFTRSN